MSSALEARILPSIFSAVIPCDGVQLLLPQALIAATLPLEALVPPLAGPDWLLGSVKLAQQRIPVLRFELLSGTAHSGFELSAAHRRNRIVVLRAASTQAAFAVLARAAPQWVSLSAEVMQPLPLRATDAEPYCLQRLALGHGQFIVPNVDALAALDKTW